MRPTNVAILIFDQVEVLDFAGPYEVFNVTAELNDPAPFYVYTVAATAAPVRTRGVLSIHPNYSMAAMPPADILVIPGGAGSRPMLKQQHMLDWIQHQATQVKHLVSICTGALVLGKAGLLDGLEATTHHESLEYLQQLAPTATVQSEKRYVDNGKILCAGGISAGIDLSLYLVRKLLGDDVLRKTLTEMEYAWTPETHLDWPERVTALR